MVNSRFKFGSSRTLDRGSLQIYMCKDFYTFNYFPLKLIVKVIGQSCYRATDSETDPVYSRR